MVSITVSCGLKMLRSGELFCLYPQIDSASEKNESLYETLKAILTPVLHELRDKSEGITAF